MSKNPPSGMIRFEGYRISNFFYDCPDDIVFSEKGSYNLQLQKNTEFLAPTVMQVTLRTIVFWSEGDNYDDAPLKVTLEIIGRFESDTDIDIKWEVNALAILFPYVRSVVSSFTAQTGKTPVILPTINVANMLKQQPIAQPSDAEE